MVQRVLQFLFHQDYLKVLWDPLALVVLLNQLDQEVLILQPLQEDLDLLSLLVILQGLFVPWAQTDHLALLLQFHLK